MLAWQMSMAKYAANVKASSECINAMESSATAGPWSKAKSWTPCAIGMLPSAFGHESIIPQFNSKLKVGYTGREVPESTEVNLSTLFSDQGNGQDSKRKAAFEAQAEIDPKRMRVVADQLMDEEAKTASDENHDDETLQTDETRGMECDEPMDEDLLDGVVDDIFDGNMDCTMEPKPSFGFDSSKPEVTTVTWQGYLLQSGVLQLGGLQELPNLQAAIRVL